MTNEEKGALDLALKHNMDGYMEYNGLYIYWKKNEVGGRTYYHEEIGYGLTVAWDTALVSEGVILCCLAREKELQYQEFMNKRSQ